MGDSDRNKNPFQENGHDWQKMNAITLMDRRGGMYDLWKCRKCGREYRRRGVNWYPPQAKCKG